MTVRTCVELKISRLPADQSWQTCNIVIHCNCKAISYAKSECWKTWLKWAINLRIVMLKMTLMMKVFSYDTREAFYRSSLKLVPHLSTEWLEKCIQICLGTRSRNLKSSRVQSSTLYRDNPRSYISVTIDHWKTLHIMINLTYYPHMAWSYFFLIVKLSFFGLSVNCFSI